MEVWMNMSKPSKYILSFVLIGIAGFLYCMFGEPSGASLRFPPYAWPLIAGCGFLFCTIMGIGDDEPAE